MAKEKENPVFSGYAKLPFNTNRDLIELDLNVDTMAQYVMEMKGHRHVKLQLKWSEKQHKYFVVIDMYKWKAFNELPEPTPDDDNDWLTEEG